MKELDRIQRMLRPGLHVSLCHTDAGDWLASVYSTVRDGPPRISYHSLTASMAFGGLLAFLRGKVPDASYSPSPARDYLLHGAKP